MKACQVEAALFILPVSFFRRYIDYASHSQWLDAVAVSFDYHTSCRSALMLSHVVSRSEDNPAYQSHRAAVDDAK
eukprot:5871333-Pleurochrysis_carterae.AAC.1